MMQTYKVAILANLRARGGRAIKALQPIMKYIEKKGQKNRFLLETPNDLSSMSNSVKRIVNEFEAELIMVFGGDGTLHKVVDKINYLYQKGEISRKPLIASIGGGTQESLLKWLGWSASKDDILKILGMSRLPYEIFVRIVNTPLEHLPHRKIRPLKISFYNAKAKNQLQHRYGFIFIMGAVNRVIELYDQDNKSLIVGLKHTALGAISSITGYPKSHAHLTHQFQTDLVANGKKIEHNNPLSIVASVTPSLLFGIKPLVGQAENNQFYFGSYAIPAWMISMMLPIIARGTIVPPSKHFFNRPISDLSLDASEETRFFVDGDFFEAKKDTKITISLDEEIELISYLQS